MSGRPSPTRTPLYRYGPEAALTPSGAPREFTPADSVEGTVRVATTVRHSFVGNPPLTTSATMLALRALCTSTSTALSR